MTALRIVEYGCSLCGTEITVTGDGSGHISPIYCCGILVSTKDFKETKRNVSASKVKRPTKKPSSAARKRSAASGKTASAGKPKAKKKKK